MEYIRYSFSCSPTGNNLVDWSATWNNAR